MDDDGQLSTQNNTPNLIKSLLVIVTAFIIAVVSGTGGYLIGRRANQPVAPPQLLPITPESITIQPSLKIVQPSISSPSTTHSQTTTANWRIYTNKKVGFQIKYPSRYSKPLLPSGPESTIYAQGTEDGTEIIFGATSSDSIGLIIFPFVGTIEELIDTRTHNLLPIWLQGSPTMFKKKLQANDVLAYEYLSIPPTVYPGDFSGYNEIYFVARDHGFILYSQVNHDERELQQMFSTFKLLD